MILAILLFQISVSVACNMGRDHNDDRRRALVKGKFKFLYQDDAEDIEATNKFELAVVQNKLLGPVKYVDKDGKDPDVLMIYGQERKEGEGYANPEVNIPGVLDLYTVVWSNPFGKLVVKISIAFSIMFIVQETFL